LKSKTIVEIENKKDEERVATPQQEEEEEVEAEDPPEIYQPGDIIWLRIGAIPWWPALIYGTLQRASRLTMEDQFLSLGCYYEDYCHTKVLTWARRSKRRRKPETKLRLL
jgi:hypothetical protein